MSIRCSAIKETEEEIVPLFYARNRPSTIFYDLIEAAARPIEPEIQFYQERSHSLTTPILEIGCGTGRISWALAEAGHQVIGIDCADAMLERAQEKQKHYGEDTLKRAHFFKADAVSFDLNTKFDLILAPYRVFNHLLTPDAQCSLLSNIHCHLTKNGQFIFDTTQPDETFFHTFSEPAIIDLPHLNLKLEQRIVDKALDWNKQILIIDYEFVLQSHDGDRKNAHRDRLIYRWTTPSEIHEMLFETGLTVKDEYKNFPGSSPTSMGNHIWVVTKAQ